VEFWQLRYFLAVCDELNFGRAAERLHVAQPSVTRAVQALEAELGVLLFIRDKRNVELTRAGQAFRQEAQAILGKVESGMRIAKRAAQGEAGTLVVGFEGSSALRFLPIAACRFRQRFPGVSIDFVQSTTHDQVLALKRGVIDLGFVVPPIVDSDVQIEILMQEELLLLMAPGHRLAEKPCIAPSEIAAERVIWPAEGEKCGTNRKIKEVLGDYVRDMAARISDTYLRTEFIAGGFGVTLAPASTARTLRDRLASRPLAPPAFIEIGVAFNKDHAPDPIMTRFLDEVKSTLRSPPEFTSLTGTALAPEAEPL
jgi:DNA-binding transcriptional LysR family regulator